MKWEKLGPDSALPPAGVRPPTFRSLTEEELVCLLLGDAMFCPHFIPVLSVGMFVKEGGLWDDSLRDSRNMFWE